MTALIPAGTCPGPRPWGHAPWRADRMFKELPRRRALDLLIRPTRVEVSERALWHNVRWVKQQIGGAGLLAVVKANAYGHGAVHVARVLEREGVAMLGVALVEEGLELRNAGVRAPILVMGGSYEGGYELMVQHELTPTLFRFEHLEGLSRAAAKLGIRARAHLKVDTGMARLGVQLSELTDFLRALTAAQTHVELDGFMSHFASADDPGNPSTEEQLRRYGQALTAVRAHGFSPRWRHVANTAGVLSGMGLPPQTDVNLVRPGILLLGVAPASWLSAKAPLEPVLSWKTGVTHLKTIEPGTAVSYGGTWVAQRRTLLATLPVGYADGFGRSFSNRGSVLIRGQRAPVVGRVTMDMSLVDVTDVPGAALHDEVVLLGAQGGLRLAAEELAALSDTIPYEIMCGIGARVPRVLVG